MAGRTLENLDSIDRKILAALQQDGRLTNSDLAKEVSLSPTPTLERVKRLERDGFIEKYVAILSADKMDAGLVAFVEVVLDRTTEDVLERFALAATQTPEIMECHMVAGGFDYLLKIRVRDMDGYRKFLGSGLAGLPGVRATHTYMVMEQVKVATALPVEPPVIRSGSPRREAKHRATS